jgi:dTDP-4-dehydrorhamnose 3,5-epimerase
VEITQLKFPGALRLLPKAIRDQRGVFVKTFEEATFRTWGLRTDFAERFFSVSRRDVVRGLHFQVPPHEHFKVVTCAFGVVMDVTLDLRVGSPTYREIEIVELNGTDGCILYLPPGIAHGFLTKSEVSVVTYEVTSAHSPSHDTGIRWDSIPLDWGVERPIISERDCSLPMMDQFETPFRF